MSATAIRDQIPGQARQLRIEVIDVDLELI
jgi:hypothetical protein